MIEFRLRSTHGGRGLSEVETRRYAIYPQCPNFELAFIDRNKLHNLDRPPHRRFSPSR
ncbi:hypothetical protein [Nostoc sp.]|uniref:hypothetical protein n=1 Tax=Nostoc sp. TaxID=1180 RepID=UPI002FF845DA